MRTAQVKQISFLMENHESIYFDFKDFVGFEIEQTTRNIVKLEGANDVVEFNGVRHASFKINAAANHTYNSFGEPSDVTSFKRLVDGMDIAAVRIHYNSGDKSLYVADEADIEMEIDEVGHLYVVISTPCDCCNDDCDCCEDECCLDL